ncbi:hypothetical protein SO694_00007350 [Aureococcus anophagefferens]|uniref:Uncharacterized protein n=1 Tax=Aureococcus anophagefferens TaxID=44056 RepID=A0ABR1GB95_AURAN
MLHTATPQYEEDTLQYAEMLENGNGALVELLKSNRPSTPRVGNPYDCCMNWYGSPAYARVRRDLVDYGSGPAERVFAHASGASGRSSNVDLVDAEGAEIDASERRRADDETFLAEECESAPEDGEVMFRLESNGELAARERIQPLPGHARLGMRPFPIQPYCSDNNATVNASASCFDVDGTERPNCVQVAFTQTAMIINCGEPGSPNNEDFSQHPHCGTFIERVSPSSTARTGRPTTRTSFVINEKRIDTALTTGYTTTTIDLAYGIQVVDRIACNYEESTTRARDRRASFFDRSRRSVGSMVYIKESSPECCCPPGYNNELKTGTFFCPKNMLEDTAGPYSNRLSTLNHYLAKDEAAADPYLVGKTYGGKQVLLLARLRGPPPPDRLLRRGRHRRGRPRATNDGGAHRCEVNDIANCPTNDMDTHFSFQGLLGKITCMPTDKEDCVNMALDQYDEDSIYYLVTFNDNRTNYAFRSTDLELHQPRHNYQLWWVQRTRYNFIVQKKKAIRVTEPTCTFDSINDRYFPYRSSDPTGPTSIL